MVAMMMQAFQDMGAPALQNDIIHDLRQIQGILRWAPSSSITRFAPRARNLGGGAPGRGLLGAHK